MSLKRTFLILLMILSASPAYASFTEICAPDLTGPVPLTGPWPPSEHTARHQEVRRAVLAKLPEFKSCIERFGSLSEPVSFSVDTAGIFDLEQSLSQTGSCFDSIIAQLEVEPYPCEFTHPYFWNGEKPVLD